MIKIATIQKLLGLFDRDEKRSVYRLLGVILVQGVAEVVGVVSVAPFMALAANPELIQHHPKAQWLYQQLNFTSNKSFLIFAGSVLLGVFLFNNLFSMFATWRVLRFSAKQNYRLSTKMLSTYLAKPYSYYLTHNSANLAKNILVECTALTEGVILPLLQGGAKFVSILLICTVLIVINPLLAVMVGTTFIGAYLIIYAIFYKGLAQYGKRRLQASSKRFQVTNEAFGGIKEVKAAGRENSFVERFAIVAKRFADMTVRNQLINQLPKYLLEIVAFGGILLVTLYLIQTKNNFSQAVPILALYALAGYRLMPSLQQLYLAITTIRFNQAVVDEVTADLQVSVTVDSLPTGTTSLPFKRDLQLKQVSFYYDGMNKPAIDKLTLTIDKNSSIAFVGSTGAGKTTAVDILLGLLKPSAGEIWIDDCQINDDNYPAWQQLIGYIPQDIYLCDGSIANNIAFGLPEDKVDTDQVEAVAKIANLYDFVVNELPEGFDTIVGERGVRLSGGQRQRIGIARALYHNPEILILDEATSALDTITEKAVVEAISALAHQKTLIMIAHRLTTVKDCDQIYFLEDGRIVDQGTFAELVNSNERFGAMAKISKEVTSA